MAASKHQMNWVNVSHNAVTIDRVTNVTFSQGGNLASFEADGDHYPTMIVNPMNRPRATVSSGNTALLMGISPGTAGSFTATHKDAKGASGGDIIYVLSNAVAENADTSGAHGQFGTASLSLQAYSADGTTNPLAFTRA